MYISDTICYIIMSLNFDLYCVTIRVVIYLRMQYLSCSYCFKITKTLKSHIHTNSWIIYIPQYIISFILAGLTEPYSCVAHGFNRAAPIKVGQKILVIGAGIIGECNEETFWYFVLVLISEMIMWLYTRIVYAKFEKRVGTTPYLLKRHCSPANNRLVTRH